MTNVTGNFELIIILHSHIIWFYKEAPMNTKCHTFNIIIGNNMISYTLCNISIEVPNIGSPFPYNARHDTTLLTFM